ncbi:carboxymuconolactone decarboxylase family protein [Amnibacterium sp. CER49]|uniref:carboxymuconolactone decarboxylase family protein n=1 Tax=Amnibacterium sp. CER49 TaxID=3039161 RepID=UPI00244C5CE9|nr:carboxymuconolactone decarboxylase family protein [Amnibacterium sp. CER49]MDH2443180.1 carboxymuconolactone decarboxylase family protein [Amnibacterium sp. CER49]
MTGRIPRLRPDELDPAQRALHDAVASGPRASGPQHFALTDADGGLLGPFNALLLSPELGGALQAVGAAVRFAADLTPRVREAAILLVAAAEDCAFERHAHEAVGRASGLTDAELAALRAGDLPGGADDDEAAHLRVTRALLHGDVDDALWAGDAARIGARAVFELSTLVGYYRTLALQLRVFRVDVDEP